MFLFNFYFSKGLEPAAALIRPHSSIPSPAGRGDSAAIAVKCDVGVLPLLLVGNGGQGKRSYLEEGGAGQSLYQKPP